MVFELLVVVVLDEVELSLMLELLAPLMLLVEDEVGVPITTVVTRGWTSFELGDVARMFSRYEPALMVLGTFSVA